MRLIELKIWGRTRLKEANIVSFKLDADLLLCFVLNKTKVGLIIDENEEVDKDKVAYYQSIIEKRALNYPLAYIAGTKEFWSLTLKVNESTLIPRPDTETIVFEALNLKLHGNVLDLGTGTGAIILSLKKEVPEITAYGCDINEKAVELAVENAKLNDLEVNFFKSSWFENVPPIKFDFIVSNPPYIENNDPHLNSDGVKFEPLKALVSGDDGLDDIRLIIKNARNYLRDGGYLLLEHGYNQGDRVREIFSYYNYKDVRTVQDLGGNDRVSLARL